MLEAFARAVVSGLPPADEPPRRRAGFTHAEAHGYADSVSSEVAGPGSAESRGEEVQLTFVEAWSIEGIK